jgi:hypothetical protein
MPPALTLGTTGIAELLAGGGGVGPPWVALLVPVVEAVMEGAVVASPPSPAFVQPHRPGSTIPVQAMQNER